MSTITHLAAAVGILITSITSSQAQVPVYGLYQMAMCPTEATLLQWYDNMKAGNHMNFPSGCQHHMFVTVTDVTGDPYAVLHGDETLLLESVTISNDADGDLSLIRIVQVQTSTDA